MTNKITAPPSPEPAEKSAASITQKQLIDSLRDAFTLVSAGAGVFAVLFYLAGRSFAGGYFGQMNIPNYLVSFSLLEYGEVAWLPLFLFPLIVIFSISSFVWAVLIVRDLLSPLFVDLLSKIGRSKGQKKFALDFSKIIIRRDTDIALSVFFWSSMAFVGMFVIIGLMTVTDSSGRNLGQKTVLETAQTVELVSAIPLALDDNNRISVKASGQAYYIYTGLRLLTFNNGKYYLFKEIDPVTCKPLKVYVINAERDIQVNLSAARPLTGQCQITNPPTAPPIHILSTPTTIQPTPTPTPTP